MYLNNAYAQERVAKFFARFKAPSSEPMKPGGQS
jgi:hypothetical protein